MREPYPLDWPEGWTRTKPHLRRHSKFKNDGYGVGRKTLNVELARINGANIVVTSNISLTSAGTPDGRLGTPSDPGVAVWWMQKGGVERVIACDRWRAPGENLRAIVKSLEALRSVDRWGASQIVDRAFAGFTALPAGSGEPVVEDWWSVLSIDQGMFESLPPDDLLIIANARYKRLAQDAHPDRGGSTEAFVRLNQAIEAAKLWAAGPGQ